MLLVGKAALNRGLPFDHYAYPVTGIPPFRSIGPEVEQSVIFSIARALVLFGPCKYLPPSCLASRTQFTSSSSFPEQPTPNVILPITR